ncbi:putative E2 protein [Equus caballus papillomavirus 7]|uniref:Regulatory protein E2 n=1 Tax=Equus caballus papillomavirus 7 TaxID=1235430 RepID=M4HXI5_9PAPI|nr:putative E2 protein [Equus caballus papillomavirus 7]AFU07687.1 putative E2 protein [Equus caballus papillomavirus 7]
MEALRSHFDAVQEGLMMHYETGSNKLQSQIEYWALTRKEQVTLYAARSKGRRMLGHTVVPSLAAAQAAAKGAIEMQLLCQKLADSPYAAEPWTMTDTSRETLQASPAGCFKKGPCLVQVQFDGEAENEMWYTLWTSIYYLNEEDQWTKTDGRVDSQGLYYFQDGVRVYYENFATEAERYSKTNVWKVFFQNETFSSLRSGAEEPPQPAGTGVQSVDELDHAAPRVSARPFTPSPARFGPLSKEQLAGSPPRYSGDSDRGQSPWGHGTPSHVSSAGSLCGGLSGQLPSPCTLSPGLSRSPLSSAASSASLPFVCGCGSPCRPETPLEDHHHKSEGAVPAVLLKGKANQLKCLRFRLKRTYWVHFWFISTTWFWAGPKGSDRAGRARMLVAFKNKAQRQRFNEKVPIPSGVERSEVSMADV